MKLIAIFAASGLLAAEIQAVPQESAWSQLGRRAFSNSPTGGYAPGTVDCPSTRPSIRSADDVSPSEAEWTVTRRQKTVQPMREFLGRLNIPNFDAAAYVNTHSSNISSLPNIGLAFSGGGYRALMNGAGALKAYDSRTPNSLSTGQLGGLLQASTYVAGLSGGAWLVGSSFVNNFSSVESLQRSSSTSLWKFSNSLVQGPVSGIVNTASYFVNIARAVTAKEDAGFESTLTDIWGRGLSHQFFDAPEGGPGISWSSIADTDAFKNGDTPLPIVIADGRAPGEIIIPENTTIYEFNPWEFGTFDPTTYGFVPMKYLGSRFSNGLLPESEPCIAGLDNVGYIIGTSSSLFNQFMAQLNGTNIADPIKSVLNKILTRLSTDQEDIADYSPNPFFGFNNATSLNAQSRSLTLVDGGLDNQNIPLHPLIQPVRAVDVIFAVDSSADTNFNWPNGSSLVKTYQRSLNVTIENGTAFPVIPDTNTFINLGLNRRPTFFGCDSSNITGDAPLIVYVPNSPFVFRSNVSTFNPLKFNDPTRDAIILNGYNVATSANATVERDWPVCVGCAVLRRSLERTSTNLPDACQQCFTKYCWNGTVDNRTPPSYEPTPLLAEIKVRSGASALEGKGLIWMVVALAGAALAL